MKTRTPRLLLSLLLAYIVITLAYQLVGTVSLITGYFDLRHQVQEPFQAEWYQPVVSTMSNAAKSAGLRRGDFIEAIDGVPLTGRAQLQAARWRARPGEIMRLTVLRADRTRATILIPLTPVPRRFNLGESAFVMTLQLVVPLFCLILGYWVALARPSDLNAWLILILLSYPQAFITVSVLNWWPEWVALRLFWHLAIEIIAPAALVWLGLLFPERSRLDVRLPWLKWLILLIQLVGMAIEFVSDYVIWFNWKLSPLARVLDVVTSRPLLAVMILSIFVYSGTLMFQLRAASSADSRRRLRVLCLGSVLGLGSNLVMWAVLPQFGYDPTQIRWLGYASSVLLLVFPLTLAYVVVVQRALDVRLLLRIGTRYILARTSLLILQFSLVALILFRGLIPFLEKGHGRMLNVGVPVIFILISLRIYFIRRSIWDHLRDRIDRRFFREAYDAEAVLSELAVSVRGILEPHELLYEVSNRVAGVLHIEKMAVLLRHGSAFCIQRISGVAYAGGPEGDFPAHEEVFLAAESTPVRHLVNTSAPAVVYRDRPENWYLDATPTERRALDELNAEVLLPLAGRNKLMGVMVLGPKLSEEAYSQTDLRLLASVGAQVGLGLEIHDLAKSLAAEAARGERMAREVEIAREVQERLFPQTLPSIPGLDLAGHCRPALAVGGDYYDLIELGDGRLALAIGDVSGKGIGAALLMASLRASLRGMTDTTSHDLAHMIRRLNRLVYESSTSNRYATFFFGIYNPAICELRYVNGGHNAPLVIREHGVDRLEATGPVVGLLKDVEFQEMRVQLGPGDLFIAYTDGISEAMTAEDEEWGDERMLKVAQDARQLPSCGILKAVFQGADDFAAGAPQYDDMTLLVLKCV